MAIPWIRNLAIWISPQFETIFKFKQDICWIECDGGWTLDVKMTNLQILPTFKWYPRSNKCSHLNHIFLSSLKTLNVKSKILTQNAVLWLPLLCLHSKIPIFTRGCFHVFIIEKKFNRTTKIYQYFIAQINQKLNIEQ